MRINSVNLENRLCYVQTNCPDRLHLGYPPNLGRLNSNHLLGTLVPVEEPSAASDSASDKTKSQFPGPRFRHSGSGKMREAIRAVVVRLVGYARPPRLASWAKPTWCAASMLGTHRDDHVADHAPARLPGLARPAALCRLKIAVR